MATKLKSLSVDIGKMGPEFANAAMEVEDASDTVRATFRKMNANKLAEKKKTSRQGNVECYFSNKNKIHDCWGFQTCFNIGSYLVSKHFYESTRHYHESTRHYYESTRHRTASVTAQ